LSRLHQISGGGNVARHADVVFVHGLGGDALATWRHGRDSSTSWPHWLGQTCPDVGIWSLEYAASPTRWARILAVFGRGSRDSGYSMALPDRARQVLDLLVQQGIGERPVMFVCHSLGGLLAKQLLRTSDDDPNPRLRRMAEQTRAVLFLSTPHAGADLASLLHTFGVVFGSTVSLEDLRAHDAHLRDLHEWYRNHAPSLRIQTVTYYELRGMRGVLPIVSPTSAHPGVGAAPVGLDEDHLSIAKPRERDAQVCGAVLDLIRTHVLAGSRTASRDTPSPAPPMSTLSPPVVIKLETDGRDADRPPRIPRELPPPAARFVGRVAEREQLITRLRAGLNTAVVGPAGLGKTALAAEALRRVMGVDASHLDATPYPDGMVYLDLYPLQGHAEPVWHVLANRICGAAFMDTRPARERATEACRARRLLLIIEGGEEASGRGGRATIAELFGVLSPENRWLLLTRLSTQAVSTDTVVLTAALDPDDAGALLDALTASRVLDARVRADVLTRLAGHPLALTWAGYLLARPEEDQRALVHEWTSQDLPVLSDPTHADRTLRWLFARSLRDVDDLARTVLAAAALLAYAPVPHALLVDAIRGESGDAPDSETVVQALKTLAQRGLLRRVDDDSWQFTHVLGHRFAQADGRSHPEVLQGAGRWLHASLLDGVRERPVGDRPALIRDLQHAATLVRAGWDQRLWQPLIKGLLYEIADRLEALGRLDLVMIALDTVGGWLQHLPPETANEPAWQHQVGVLVTDHGDVLQAQGDLAGALAAYREALAISRRLVEADPSHAGWQRDLSVSQNKVGDVLQAQGDLTGALGAYRETLAISRRLAEAAPSHAGRRRDLSVCQTKVGDVLRAQDDLTGALATYREALAIRKHLVEADPSHAGWQRDLSVCHERIGDVLQAQGDLAGALAAYREELAISRRLAEADPSHAGWQRDLGVSQTKVGDALQEQGDLTGALTAYREALAIGGRLAEADPSHAGWQRDLSVGHERIGGVLQGQGDLAGALGAYREALAISKRLAEADPSHAGWQRDLSVDQNKVGQVLQAQGDLAGALAAYREALAIRRHLAEANPSHAGWQRDLCAGHERIGDVLQAQGDLVGALAAYREALAIRRHLAEANPSHAGWQRDLSFSLTRLAQFHEQQRDVAVSLRLALESLAIDERLAALDPTNVVWRRDVTVSRALVTRLREGAAS
jgi:tetratricopeptide (TPR) repeat protein